MSYGDEQAEARRLRSILEEKPGGSMTPPTRPDPVAALTAAYEAAGQQDFWPKGRMAWVVNLLAEQGYVLVSADLLRTAVHELGGEFCQPFTTEHPMAMHNSQAAAIFAALRGPAR